MPDESLIARLEALWQKVDAKFAEIQTQHADEMQCGAGCDTCCSDTPTILSVEAAAIAKWLADNPRQPPSRADGCIALDRAGQCSIYQVRPLVCRSHGVPIRMEERGLPVVRACHLNFARGFEASVAAGHVIDQTTLSTIALAIDQLFAGSEQPRVPLDVIFSKAE